MGIDCAERVARIFTLLLDHPDFAGLFSDIHAAMEALRKLESTAVPTEWGDFDRIAIDEIQDLTAIEFALISSFHTQISTNQGRLVWLLLAGDEGQTVVPTDFSWGAMKSQLHASLNCLLPDVLIEEFKLESNLRCPHKITEVINRSAGLYRKFPRAARPANQTPGVEGQALQAQLLRIACSREEACYAVGCLAEEGRLIFLRLDSAWPDWIPKKLRDFILTPEEAKGLEYQAVCILDPGKKLAQIEAAAASGHELEELAARAMIDRLRVALSRATETLVFLDVEADPAQHILSWELLGHSAETEIGQLIDDLHKSEPSLEDRAATRLRISIEIEDQDIHRAWRLAHDALQLLGDPNLPNGVTDENLRSEVRMRILSLGAHMMLNLQSDEVTEAVASAVGEAIGGSKMTGLQVLFDALKEWAVDRLDADRPVSGLKVLKAIEALGDDGGWIRAVASGHAQSLRQAINAAAKSPATAPVFSGNPAAWLAITGKISDSDTEANRLRTTAFDTLITAKKFRAARSIHALLPADNLRLARLLEGEKDHTTAAAAFELAGHPAEALRNWRAAGKWEEALRLAEAPEKADLQWLTDLQRLLATEPIALAERLTPAEKKRYATLWKSPGRAG